MDAWKTDFSKNIEKNHESTGKGQENYYRVSMKLRIPPAVVLFVNFKTFADEQVIVRTGISKVSTIKTLD